MDDLLESYFILYSAYSMSSSFYSCASSSSLNSGVKSLRAVVCSSSWFASVIGVGYILLPSKSKFSANDNSPSSDLYYFTLNVLDFSLFNFLFCNDTASEAFSLFGVFDISEMGCWLTESSSSCESIIMVTVFFFFFGMVNNSFGDPSSWLTLNSYTFSFTGVSPVLDTD